MGAKQIIRIQKHNSHASVKRSGKHNFREQETINADPLRRGLNVTTGAQTSSELVRAVQKRVDLATVKATGGQDKPVLCVEYMITASPEFFKESDQETIESYFDDAHAWVAAKHGEANIVCRTRHNDESTPHEAIFVVPLVEREAGTRKRSVIVGKDDAGKPIRETREFATKPEIALSAKHYFGGSKERLSRFQTEFFDEVSCHYGLERGEFRSQAKHQAPRRSQDPIPVQERKAVARDRIIEAIGVLPDDKQRQAKELIQDGLNIIEERERMARNDVVAEAKKRDEEAKKRDAEAREAEKKRVNEAAQKNLLERQQAEMMRMRHIIEHEDDEDEYEGPEID